VAAAAINPRSCFRVAAVCVEWAFWDHWTAKIEYLYIDFGNNGSNFNAIATGHFTNNIARAGVN
jgi:opacity protein-like surface antigen